MLHFIQGKLIEKREGFVVVEAGNFGFKVFVSGNSVSELPLCGQDVFLYTHLHYREPSFDLYGFKTSEELELFGLLIGISGIGPKSALGILGLAETSKLALAINSGESDLLVKVSGVGRKTAERVVLELKGKLERFVSEGDSAELMKSEKEIEDALLGLGFSKGQIKEALKNLEPDVKSVEDRLKLALKYLKK